MPRRSSHDAGPNVDAADPRSAYVHVPFCAHRCGYCDFTVVAGRGDLVGDYLRAIELELQQLGDPKPVETLYFGGGTPTQLPLADLARLCDLLDDWHPRQSAKSGQPAEWTVEANPADVTTELINQLADRGVTRLSLGGQSFNPDKLRVLERDHAPGDIERSVTLAKQAGLAVGIDLIFATPGETLEDWLSDLRLAQTLDPEHFSTYGLTYERGTSFWTRRLKGSLAETEEELQREMYLAAIDGLAIGGWQQYEVSNFAKPGYRSRHNGAYWSGEGYWAVGPGATRFVGGLRQTNHRSTTGYLKRVLAGDSPVMLQERLDPEQRAREVLVFSLRQIEGITRSDFNRRTGFELDALAGEAISRLVGLGLLEESSEQLRLTREGLLLSDALWPELL